ncbi:MAG: hypothetical protein ACFFC7_16120 [Candidatus Hermodarchaeota archaeon]
MMKYENKRQTILLKTDEKPPSSTDPPEIDEGPSLQKDHIIGVTNKSFTPEFLSRLGAILGTTLKETDIALLGRDFRRDSLMLQNCFSTGLISTGVSSFNLDAIPGTILQFLIRRIGASAGILFAASHTHPNEIELRIFDESGSELSQASLHKMLNELKLPDGRNLRRVEPNKIGRILTLSDTQTIYHNALIRMVNTQSISQMQFKITVDCSLGPIFQIMPSLLADLCCNVISLNCFQPFHPPKVFPNNQSLVALIKSLVATNSDIGVVFDQRGSQVHFIDGTGTFVDPTEVTLLLALDRIQKAESTANVVVISQSLGEQIQKALAATGTRVKTIDVTTTSLSRAIRQYRAIFGAADDGSYYYPAFSPGCECILATLNLLDIMAQREQSLSQLVHPVAHQRTKFIQTLPEEQNIMNGLGTLRSSEFQIIDTIIGYKFVFPDNGWVSLYPTRQLGVYTLVGQRGETSTEQALFKKVLTILKTMQEQDN